jgi:hypothetical protein
MQLGVGTRPHRPFIVVYSQNLDNRSKMAQSDDPQKGVLHMGTINALGLLRIPMGSSSFVIDAAQQALEDPQVVAGGAGERA